MSTKDRKEREKENRRQTILQAAEAIMMANGLHGLSIDLIAQETQLAKRYANLNVESATLPLEFGQREIVCERAAHRYLWRVSGRNPELGS